MAYSLPGVITLQMELILQIPLLNQHLARVTCIRILAGIHL